MIAAGGTAGHVVPALAVADELHRRGAEVSFIGGRRAEAELVPAAGYELRTLAVEGLSRSNPLRALRALGRSGAAVLAARRMLGELEPAAVMGGGGYVSGPVGLAALVSRLPLVLTEADSHLGLANRLLARGARRVCLAFPPDGPARANFRVTGRPIPPPRADRALARKRFGVADAARCVLVFGGSLGARTINLAAVEGLAELVRASERVRVLHICGRRDHPELMGRQLPERYELIEYLDTEGFDAALTAADLAIARSGGSVFEIAAHGLPAILVPYPHAAGDHQRANARWMASAGAATVIEDAELDARRLRGAVEALLGDGSRLAAMAAASRSLARPRAAAEVADELILAAAGRSSR